MSKSPPSLAVLLAAVAMMVATLAVQGVTAQDAVPDPAGIVKPYPDEYDIGIDDDELLLFAGVWSPRTGWEGDNFFLVESDVPVILNRLTAGSASGSNWGVPWGVSVIVKTDCGNGTALEDEIELEIDPMVSTGMADVNGASIPKISILAALGEVDVQDGLVAESRMGHTDHGNDDDYFKTVASSEFSREFECWSQIGECVPKIIEGSTDRPFPFDKTAAPAAAANADTGPPITMIDGVVPASTPDDSNAVTIDTEGPPAAAATDGPVGSPVATSTVTDGPSTTSSAFSAKRITTSFFLGLVMTASLLILGTVGIAFDKPGSRSTMIGVSAIAVFAAMILAILPPPAHSLSSSSGAYESIRSLNANHEDHHNHQCAVTVEIVYWGCDHQVYIDAPGATLRYSVDTSESNWDTCECQETHTFVDANPGDETNADEDFSEISESFNMVYQDTIVNEIGESSTVYRVAGGMDLDRSCNIAVGRPYRDSSGNAVSASLCEAATEHKTSEIQDDKSKHKTNQPWSEPSLSFLSSNEEEESRNPPQRLGVSKDRTKWNEQEQPRLGAEWTHRALGEHASIASFAAFALALMSNQAPPDLIRDALTAAQDELRHAKVSFEIASMLSGVVVEPTALPPSTLQFGANRTELALATAREGCIEETLSAIELAVDYDEFVAASIGTDASSVEEKIMDTTKTIALEEGNHSVLAWRTMEWICNSSGDDNTNGNEACEAVQQHVLDPSKLVEAGERRFPSSPRAREIWDCIWKSLLPLIFASVDVDMVDENNDGYSSKCPSDGILGNTVRDGDTNSATLSELLAYKIVSKVKPNAATFGANSVYEIN